MATKRRLSNEINAGSMADIAFLLLIFFLVTTTISEDKGVLVRLPEWAPEPPPPIDVKQRNIFQVFVNATGSLLVRGEATDVGQLKEKAKLFVFNPYHDPAFAESPRNAVITLKNDRGTPYGTYLEVYDALKSAYKEIWEELAMTKYGKVWSDLSPALQKKIKDEVPMVISEAEPTAFGEEM